MKNLDISMKHRANSLSTSPGIRKNQVVRRNRWVRPRLLRPIFSIGVWRARVEPQRCQTAVVPLKRFSHQCEHRSAKFFVIADRGNCALSLSKHEHSNTASIPRWARLNDEGMRIAFNPNLRAKISIYVFLPL